MILDIGRKYYILDFVETFLDSSMVEHSAVNRVVVGSSPTRGAVGVEGLPFLFIRICAKVHLTQNRYGKSVHRNED